MCVPVCHCPEKTRLEHAFHLNELIFAFLENNI